MRVSAHARVRVLAHKSMCVSAYARVHACECKCAKVRARASASARVNACESECMQL